MQYDSKKKYEDPNKREEKKTIKSVVIRYQDNRDGGCRG